MHPPLPPADSRRRMSTWGKVPRTTEKQIQNDTRHKFFAILMIYINIISYLPTPWSIEYEKKISTLSGKLFLKAFP
jgi:hypothetical protein